MLLLLLLLPFSIDAKEIVKFSKCVDGDTIKVIIDEKEYTVRMLAIDTPESVHPTKKVEHYGKEASEFTCNLVTNAKKLELEYDPNSAKTDKYERLLAWVFVDDYLLQDSLVRNGYAEVAYLYGDYIYTNTLKDHQELAKVEKLNIWSEEELKNDEVNIYIVVAVGLLGILLTYLKKRLTKELRKRKIKKEFNLR